MAANTGKLAGKTVFITGASRGIGKAIALKVAKDGANVVIAARTAEAHPKLPGTIYTAAEEVNKVGGHAFPCIVDVGNEEQVQEAVKQTVAKFGGIDILVNNAYTACENMNWTSMKMYDLMNRINTRGTYLCSLACLPYLLKSKNPHILNICPPMNMSPKWFGGQLAYTISKYGVSMCVLGMAEEFRSEGLAVNALWPRTIIWTSAIAYNGGGDYLKIQCRKVDIVSDAAYIILTSDSREFTGNFTIDDDIVRSAGITDLEQYSFVPGNSLLTNFFLNEGKEELMAKIQEAVKDLAAFEAGRSSQPAARVGQIFSTIQKHLSETLVKDIGASYQFDLSGPETGIWHLNLKTGRGSAGKGGMDSPDCVMTLDSQLFQDMFAGKTSPTTVLMTDNVKIEGDTGAALKLEKIMKKLKST